MSDMKTLTIRDLDRTPSAVRDASLLDGRVRVKARTGQSYLIAPENNVKPTIRSLPNFDARRKRLFSKPISSAKAALFDSSLAGE